MTLHNYEIVDCGAFCEVIFFCILPKNLLGDFFYSLSRSHQVENPYRYTRFPAIIRKKYDCHNLIFLLTKWSLLVFLVDQS
jgi:hypothetical protein